jgi:hypothetical protein
VGRQDDIYASPAAQVHDYLTRLEARKTGGVTAASGEIQSDLGR